MPSQIPFTDLDRAKQKEYAKKYPFWGYCKPGACNAHPVEKDRKMWYCTRKEGHSGPHIGHIVDFEYPAAAMWGPPEYTAEQLKEMGCKRWNQ